MKVILAFVGGTLFGAIALFFYLREIGHDPYVPPATAVVATAPVAVNPAAPVITTDLSEANLPIRPAPTTEMAVIDANAAAVKEANTAVAGAAPGTSTTPAPASEAPPGAGKLLVPVEGIKAAQLTDTFDQPRGTERHHEALDIMAPTGTKVVAVADGKIAKLFNSKPGGLTVYQFDPTEKFAYYYAHLDRYADGLKEGATIKRGELIGYVGATGNANPAAPHLHFAVVELTPEKQWWKGTPLNPYPLLGD
jgi:murein DD-endopeptidase MepM/ murein hydrolase activator NlpD